MRKQYSLLGGNFSRMHPLALLFIVTFILAFLSSGIIKVISITVFLIILTYLISWLYQEIWG